MTVKNHHYSAAALVVEAAKRSGLLRRVAVALYNDFNNGNFASTCPACAMLEELTEELGDLFPSSSEGFPTASDEELALYLNDGEKIAVATAICVQTVADRNDRGEETAAH